MQKKYLLGENNVYKNKKIDVSFSVIARVISLLSYFIDPAFILSISYKKKNTLED